MDKIERIKIEGFRRLNNIDLEMRPLMVMIGANGVGKTSFLDVIALLSATANKSLNTTLNRTFGGINDLLTWGKSDSVSISLQCFVNEADFQYDIHIHSKGQAYGISSEKLVRIENGKPTFNLVTREGERCSYYDGKTHSRLNSNLSLDLQESLLSQVPTLDPRIGQVKKSLNSTIQYHRLDVGPRSPIKLPQQMRPADFPGEDGEDLVSFLYTLKETDRDRYEMVEDTLKAAFPGFENLSFPLVAAGMVAMTWKEQAFSRPLYMHQLSEGTLRFLWLTSLLASNHLPMVTMIDEPEVSLHPELLSLLAELMRATSQRTQLIVATHSDRLIRFMEPKEVVVMDRNEQGFTDAKWADSFDLGEWLADYSLDELWRRGLVGGRS